MSYTFARWNPAGAATNHDIVVAIPSIATVGPKRKLLFAIARETNFTVNAVLYGGAGGVDFVSQVGPIIQHPTATDLGARILWYDIDDGDLPDGGNKTIRVTMSSSSSSISGCAWVKGNSPLGAPGVTDYGTVSWTDSTPTAGGQTAPVTAVAGGAGRMFALAVTSSATSNWAFPAVNGTTVLAQDVAEETDGENNEAAYTSAGASGEITTAGTKTATGQVSAASTGNKVMVTLWIAEESGPTITTQPTDQVMVNGPAAPAFKAIEVPIAYTLSETLVGVRVEQEVGSDLWEEISDEAFAVEADNDGAILTITEPDYSTWNGATLRLVVEDGTGETSTVSFTLTIYAGAEYAGDLAMPESGPAVGDLTSDVPCEELAAVFGLPGVFIEVPVVSGGATVRGGASSEESV